MTRFGWAARLAGLAGFFAVFDAARLIRPKLHRFETAVDKVIDARPLAAGVGERRGALAAVVGSDLGSSPRRRPA